MFQYYINIHIGKGTNSQHSENSRKIIFRFITERLVGTNSQHLKNYVFTKETDSQQKPPQKHFSGLFPLCFGGRKKKNTFLLVGERRKVPFLSLSDKRVFFNQLVDSSTPFLRVATN